MTRLAALVCLAWVYSPNPLFGESRCSEVRGDAATSTRSASSDDAKPQEPWQTVREVLKRGIRINMTESGSSYAKLSFTTQVWGRIIDTNPGSLDVDTERPIDLYLDLGIRRARWMVFASIENKIIFFSQIGITSFANTAPGRNPFYIHDFQGQVQYLDGHYFGAGLHFWQGLSRFSRVAHTGYLTLDNEGFNFPNVFVDDWVVRQIGPFLRGLVGRFGYSLATNIPSEGRPALRSDTQIRNAAEDNVAVLRRHSSFNFRGYLYYSFLAKDKPFSSGAYSMTYLGKKGPVLNIGAGWQIQPNGVGYWDAGDGEVKKQSSKAGAVDLFLELPLFDESVLNFYAAYYRYDFGPNYVKTQNIMGKYAKKDPDSETLLPGPGHVIHAWGTGNLYHAEVGYILPRSVFDSNTRLQPYFALTVRDMERFAEPSFMYHAGINWLIVGHNLKVTAEYYNRPLFDQQTLKVVRNPATFILQLQLRI